MFTSVKKTRASGDSNDCTNLQKVVSFPSFIRDMSKKSSDKSKQTTLSGFVNVVDNKRRKMDQVTGAEAAGGVPTKSAEKVNMI